MAGYNWLSMLKHSTIDLLKLLGVAALYALLLYISEGHFESGAIVGYFESASGLALAALLLGGKRYVWGVPIGAFLINAISDNSLWEVVIVASGDTLQAFFGAWLLTRDGKFDLRLQSLRDYLRLILLGGGASIAIGALAVSTTLLVSGLLTPANYFHSLIQWWMSDTLGVILIAPLILVWWGTRNDWREAGKMIEAVLLLGLTIFAGQAVFLDWWHDSIGLVAKGYWMFLIATWAAVRLGARETVVVLVMTATYALLGAIHGVGFFADDIAQTHLVNYWLYMVTLSIIGMALATHFTERKQLEQQLSRRLRHRDVMERISRISLNSASIEELLGRVLDEMLTVFNADRAYFLYPCDPDAPSWSVPMERTRPEWPGAFGRGMVIPMTPEDAGVLRELLASTKPLPYGPASSRCIPAAVAEQFSIRSMIQVALRPRVGSPWVMGLHHCAQARAYNEDDLLIFKDIGLRVADALSSMIMLKSLRESEENLNHAQAVGQVGSWLLNIATNRLEWSAETYRMFGIPQQQAVDLETFAAATHPDDRDFVLKAWGEAMAGAPYDIEHRIVVGGEERWVRERARIELDSEGRPLTGIGTVQDITERRKAEEELRTLSTAVEQSPLSVVITDLDANILYVNPCFINATGYSREDVIGQNPRILQSGLNKKAAYAELWNSLGSGKVWRGELVNKRKNGELYWEEAHIAPATNSAGVTTHYVAVKLEITQRKQAERVLAESEERFRLLVESSPFCIHEIDLEGCLQSMNRAGLDMLGLDDAGKICGMPYLSAVSQQDAGRVGALLRDAIANGTPSHFEFAVTRDVPLYFKSCFIPIKDTNGKVLKLMGITEDITKRKKAELALMRYKLVIDTVNDGFWITDAMGNMLEVNTAYAKMSGYSVDELVNMHVSQLEAIERSVGEVIAHIERIVARGYERFETRHRHKDGHEIDVEVSATFMSELQQFFVFIHDITKRKQAEEQIRNLAFYDTLTQLPNRRLLNDRLGQTIAASKRSSRYGALMFIDLDNFKPLNDTYGHDVGDLLLIEVAHRLTSCVREVDTVARFGGDEFVVMLSELDEDKAESIAQAATVAKKVRAILAESYVLKLQPEGNAETAVEHHCTSSIGVVLFVNHEASPEDILKWADKAMYQAKEDGGNLVRFFDSES